MRDADEPDKGWHGLKRKTHFSRRSSLVYRVQPGSAFSIFFPRLLYPVQQLYHLICYERGQNVFSCLLQRRRTNHFGNCKPAAMWFSPEIGLFAELIFGVSLQAWLPCTRREEHMLNIFPAFVTLCSGIFFFFFQKYTEVYLLLLPTNQLSLLCHMLF